MFNAGKALFGALVAAALCGAAAAQQVEVMWLGHATFRITSVAGKVIVIDPYLIKNPRTPAKYKDLAALGKVDLILVTHGHADHMSDLPELAKITGATVVAPYELGRQLVFLGLVEQARMSGLNKGGATTPVGPAIKVHMVQAQHSSSIDVAVVKPEMANTFKYLDGGPAVGYVIEFENGYRIYHTGDTDIFGDMALIQRLFKPDLALVSIGGYFTMDPQTAALAMREYVKPKVVVPMHYGTNPVINRTAAEFKAALGNAPIRMIEMKPGEPLRF